MALNIWNASQVYSVERMSKIKSILSIILMQCMGLSVSVYCQLMYFFFDDYENMCTLP